MKNEYNILVQKLKGRSICEMQMEEYENGS
jgi:hypothetical protein